MREPYELQVWPDGSLAGEIEFVGADVRAQPHGGEAVGRVLAVWADARGWQLSELYNDRGRSLPDVWNARFVRRGDLSAVADAVEFARRAALVAETHNYDGGSVDRLVALLRTGDLEGVLGTPVTPVFQPRPAPDAADPAAWDETVRDVCAFANAVHGGVVVLGLDEQGGRVSGVSPFAANQAVDSLRTSIGRCVYPSPDGLVVEACAAAITTDADADIEPVPGAPGIVVVVVPPQDRALAPFLVHGGLIDERHQSQGVCVVERRDAVVYSVGIAAMHAQLAAGGALLRREGNYLPLL